MRNILGIHVTPFFKRLLLIQAAGLMFSVLLGLILYFDQAALPYLAVFAATALVSVGLFNMASTRSLTGVGKQVLSFAASLNINGVLFSILSMSLLCLSMGPRFDAQQLFFLAMLSAASGMMLARIWDGLTVKGQQV